MESLNLPSEDHPTGAQGMSNSLASEVAVYKNALEKVVPQEEISGLDTSDPQTTFKTSCVEKPLRESSSSDEGKIDTSDELMEIDCNNFIAECAAEASQRRNLDGKELEDRRVNATDEANEMIRKGRSNKN